MKKIIFLLAVLALVSGCAQQAQIDDSTVFEMKRFGAFTMPEMAVTEVVVEPGMVTYTTYNYNGEITAQVEKDISQEQYDSVLSAFREADFTSLPNSINPDVNIADVGEANLTVSSEGYRKVVNIAPYATMDLSPEMQSLLEQMESMIMYAQDLSSEEAEELATEWIRDSPTYAYDGRDLQLVDHQVLESYPVQHLMTFEFTSSQAGYGDRSGQMTAQVITPHTVKIKVANARVISAVMDDKWDMVAQEMIVKDTVKLRYQPMQCDETPWQQWYSEGNIQFIKEPTQEELITAYYSDMGVEVSDVVKVETDRMVCQACSVCPTTHYFTMKAPSEYAEDLQGWKPINETR